MRTFPAFGSGTGRDRHGFILTGRDLPGEDPAKAGQPVPLPLETSLPGVSRPTTCTQGQLSEWRPLWEKDL